MRPDRTSNTCDNSVYRAYIRGPLEPPSSGSNLPTNGDFLRPSRAAAMTVALIRVCQLLSTGVAYPRRTNSCALDWILSGVSVRLSPQRVFVRKHGWVLLAQLFTSARHPYLAITGTHDTPAADQKVVQPQLARKTLLATGKTNQTTAHCPRCFRTNGSSRVDVRDICQSPAASPPRAPASAVMRKTHPVADVAAPT